MPLPLTRALTALATILVLLSSAGCAATSAPWGRQAAAGGSRSVEAEVRQRFEALAVAARLLDVPAYLAFFDASAFSALNGDGTVMHALPPFAEMYRASIESVEGYVSLEFDRVHVSPISDDVAILVNEYTAVVRLKTGDVVEGTGAGSQVWSKASGEWLLVSVSSSSAGQ